MQWKCDLSICRLHIKWMEKGWSKWCIEPFKPAGGAVAPPYMYALPKAIKCQEVSVWMCHSDEFKLAGLPNEDQRVLCNTVEHVSAQEKEMKQLRQRGKFPELHAYWLDLNTAPDCLHTITTVQLPITTRPQVLRHVHMWETHTPSQGRRVGGGIPKAHDLISISLQFPPWASEGCRIVRLSRGEGPSETYIHTKQKLRTLDSTINNWKGHTLSWCRTE